MIKGLKPVLAEAGKIKIGRLSDKEYESKGGKKYRRPVKLDHFLVTKTTRGADGQLEIDEHLMTALKKHGAVADEQVRAIPIVLHSDDIDQVFPTVYAGYAGRQLFCRGDGEKAIRWVFDQQKVKTGEVKSVGCPCSFLDDGKCKPHGTLHCSIALPGHAVAGAVYRWRTTGIISIQRMIGSLQQILATVGTLRNVPLTLCVQPVDVSPDGRKQTVYSCHVELRASDLVETQKRALEARKTMELLGAPKPMALIQAPADDNETPEEQAEVAEEFFPEPEVLPPQESTVEAVKAAAKKTAEKEEEPPPPGDDDDVPDYGEPDE